MLERVLPMGTPRMMVSLKRCLLGEHLSENELCSEDQECLRCKPSVYQSHQRIRYKCRFLGPSQDSDSGEFRNQYSYEPQ